MKRSLILMAIVLVALTVAGCTQSAAPAAPTSAPTAPTTAPAAPTKAAAAPAAAPAAPTKAAAVPTVAPAKKIDWPEKGKTITTIVPYGAGGAGDIGARKLAPEMAKELGVNIEVVNEPGAGAQIGLTHLAQSKPDGYTLGWTHLPATITIYLDPERQPAFGRKDLQPIGMFVDEANVLIVKGDSPYKTLKDLIEAAKAAPGKIKVGDSGILGDGHITSLRLEKEAGIRLAVVHTAGGAQTYADVLGGNTDGGNVNVGGQLLDLEKSGQVRALAIFAKQRDPRLPNLQTAEEQGYPVIAGTSRALSAPGGTPREIVDIVSNSMKKVMESPDFKAEMDKLGFSLRYMSPTELEAYWDSQETAVKPLIEELRKK